jgi:hypothetical protein
MKETPMEAVFQFAGLAMVVLASISFALLLEWLSLWGLMKLMPATQPEPKPAALAAPIPTVPRRMVPIHSRRLRLHAAGR